jgi:N,N'-diacetyllegionaminate synthase
MKIENKILSRQSLPFIVAEAGINHNGEIKRALEMIRVAKEIGVDAIKFQTFNAKEFVSNSQDLFTYKSQGKIIKESMLEMFQRHEFSQKDWQIIKKECDKQGIIFLSTPQNVSDLKILLDLKIPAIKVGSDDFINLPLLKEFKKTKLPLILSCGMSDLAEIFQTLEFVGSLNGYPTILLLTTSQYPTPSKDVNISRLRTLSGVFPMIKLGYSDHTRNSTAVIMAVTLGALFFEKHFTLDHNLPGPDHWFSANPKELKEWKESIINSHSMIGDGVVKPSKTEIQHKKEFRRIIVSTKNIKKNETFKKSNIGMRRIPSKSGLAPSMYEKLLGEKSTKHYKKGIPIER